MYSSIWVSDVVMRDGVQETPHECSCHDQEQIDSVLQATTVTADIGESAATVHVHCTPMLLRIMRTFQQV